jgi:hypothetical protein
MAAASPIVLNSSSPVSYQIPSVTPPSEHKKSRILVASSSSPGLVSPSAFVKPRSRPSGLKSGSRVQQAPDGPQIGFASAGSLWNVHELVQAKQQDDEAAEQDAGKERFGESKGRSTGKLVKPKKAVKQQQDGEPPTKRQKMDEYAYTDSAEPTTKPTKRKVKAVSKVNVREAHQPRTILANSALDAYSDAQSNKDDEVKKVVSKPKRKTKKALRQDENQSHVPKANLQFMASPSRPVESPTVSLEDFTFQNNADAEIATATENMSLTETNCQIGTSAVPKPGGSLIYFEKGRIYTQLESLQPAVSRTLISLKESALAHTVNEAGQSIEKTTERLGQDRKESANSPGIDTLPNEAPVKAFRVDDEDLRAITERQPVNLANFEPDPPVEPKDATKPLNNAAPKSKKSRQDVDSASNACSDLVKASIKKPRRRKKKSESVILNSDDPELFDGPVTTSHYFTELQSNRYETVKARRQSLPRALETTEDVRLDSAEMLVTRDTNTPAASKRREWTPVKDSIRTDLTVDDANAYETIIADSDDSAGPKRQLADVLDGLSYVSNEAGIATNDRIITGEALTKRRRVELAPPVAIHSAIVSPDTAIKPDLAKRAKQKKGRKKAQTITALATAAFQPPDEVQTDDGAMSHFFSPSKSNSRNNAETEDYPVQKVKKARKPRKPKEKTDAAASNTKAKKSKPKKAKGKFNEADYTPKLYSPGRATAQLKNQAFLFGTSSQLAMDEPASFIRDMQVAIQQSEQQPGAKLQHSPVSSQTPNSQALQSPHGKSCIRVPTAPHGTCLSIEQARRELWCVSTRDFEGSVLRLEDASAIEPLQYAEQSMPVGRLPMLEDVLALDAEAHGEKQTISEYKGIAVDLCDTSVQEPLEPGSANVNYIGAQRQEHDCVEQPVCELTLENSDDWMLIESSSPFPAAQPVGVSQMPQAAIALPVLGDAKLLSPRRFRPPLSPLNPNTLMAASWAAGKDVLHGQIRSLSSTVADQERKSRSKSPGKRGPERPRKDSTSNSPSANPPKQRGRLSKSKALISEPSQLSKPKKQKIALSASQPLEETGFIDIEDIYDSDSPTTPSPPRRRSTLSPPSVQPLTLSPSIQAKAPTAAAAAAAALKSKDSHWAVIRSDLFDRIMAAVKSLPPSNNASKPTWYEKILLYDPIVLEDFTAWLNDQGLRVEMRKQKAKPKKRGRKRKDADAVGEEEVEWEVQKFCEEKSICCLWKEGLRGGVRTRY